MNHNFNYNNNPNFYNFKDDKINASNQFNDGVRMYQQHPDNKKSGTDPSMHAWNIERSLMERGNMFNMDTQNNSEHDNNQNSQNNTQQFINKGEITGEFYDMSDQDQGMPMRTFGEKPNDKFANGSNTDHEKYNPQLDFELYNQRSTTNVSYYDPHQISGSIQTNFSDINGTNQLLPPIERISLETKFSALVNSFSWDLFNKFQQYMNTKSKFMISPFNIVITMSILYKGARGGSAEEIRKFFSLPSKDDSINALLKINNDLKVLPSMVQSNLVLFPRIFPLNKVFVDFIAPLGIIESVDSKNCYQTSEKINSTINHLTDGIVTKLTTPSLFNANNCILLINSLCFYSKWKYPFNKKHTQKKIFNGTTKRDEFTLHLLEKSLRFFEDNVNQIIELDYAHGEEFTMGIILPKNSSNLILSHEQFEYYISQLTFKRINIVQIPKFRQQSKYKIDNLFKNLGMTEIFNNADFSEIIQPTEIGDDVFISDIIHHTFLVVDESGESNNEKPQKQHNFSSINFIANHPFIYYIRYKPTNTVILVGQYN
jgi:serpin B